MYNRTQSWPLMCVRDNDRGYQCTRSCLSRKDNASWTVNVPLMCFYYFVYSFACILWDENEYNWIELKFTLQYAT